MNDLAVYETAFPLRTADFDRQVQPKPSAVLDLFQEAAAVHSERLGAGRAALDARGLIWVLARVRYRVLALPAQHSTVRVRTWPHAPARLIFGRDYEICTDSGAPLIHGTSEWVLLDVVRRRMTACPDIYAGLDAYEERRLFDGRLLPLSAGEATAPALTIVPGYADLDQNGHVNNTRYADFALNALPPEKIGRIAAFGIDYHRELRAGEPLALGRTATGDGYTICGTDGQGERMFVCRVDFAMP